MIYNLKKCRNFHSTTIISKSTSEYPPPSGGIVEIQKSILRNEKHHKNKIEFHVFSWYTKKHTIQHYSHSVVHL